MWPFRRRREADAEGPASPGAEDVSSTAPAPSAPRSPEAWRTMGPLQRTIGEAPHTYRTDDIGEILTSWNSPRLSGELGHQVSPDAPAGVLHDMATVVQSAAPANLPASTETPVLRELPHEHRHDGSNGHGRAAAPASRSTQSVAASAPSAPASTAGGSSPTAQRQADPSTLGTGDDRATPSTTSPDRPITDAPLRTLAASPAPVPTVSRLTAPDVMPPRPLAALALQRSADLAAPPYTPERGATTLTSERSDPGTAAASVDAAPAPSPPSEAVPSADDQVGAALPANPLVTPPAPGEAPPPHSLNIPPGAVLGPPIQPRNIQRRPVDMPLPPVQRSTDDVTAASSPPATTDAASTASVPQLLPTDEGAPTGASPQAPASIAPEAPLAGDRGPLVQRTPEGDHAHDDDDAHEGGSPDAGAATGPSMPLQRQVTDPKAANTERPTPVRPLGLGEPLADPQVPPTISNWGDDATPPATGSSAPPAPSLPLTSTPPAVQRDAHLDGPQPPAALPGGDSGEHELTAPLTGGRDVTRRAGDQSPIGGRPTPAEPEPAAASDAPGSEHTTSVTPALALSAPVPPRAPITVSTLRDTGLVLQRSLDEGPPTVIGATPSSAPSPVPAAHAPSTLPAGTLRAATQGPALQRTTLSPASVPGRPPSGMLQDAPLSPAASPPSMTLASPARPEVVDASWPDAGDIAVANGVAQRMPDGSVQFTVQREGGSVRDRISQWEGLAGSTMGGAMSGTRLGAGAPASTGEQGGPAITATASPAPEAPPSGGNEREELEQQVRKMWPLIRRKLTNEMLSRPEGRRPGW